MMKSKLFFQTKKLIRFLSIPFCFFILASCNKDKAFKDYYGKSGIWEITNLKVDYTDSTGAVDSSATYANCGMFIFYNSDIGALRQAFLGQVGITTFTENHLGVAWYPENGKLNLTESTASIPIRIYTISGKGTTQTWTYFGKNYGVLPGYSLYVKETVTVNRIKTK